MNLLQQNLPCMLFIKKKKNKIYHVLTTTKSKAVLSHASNLCQGNVNHASNWETLGLLKNTFIKEKKIKIALNQFFVPKLAFKVKSHKNST